MKEGSRFWNLAGGKLEEELRDLDDLGMVGKQKGKVAAMILRRVG